MTRRRTSPPRQSLLDLLPARPAVPVSPAAPEPSLTVVPEATNLLKGWYCVRDPRDPCRDLVAVLDYYYPKDNRECGIRVVPALGRRWEFRTDWLEDVFAPSARAIRDYALSLGIPPEVLDAHAYTTCAWQGETRPVLRGEPSRGVPPRERRAPTPARPDAAPPSPVEPKAVPAPVPALPQPETTVAPDPAPPVPPQIEPPFMIHGVIIGLAKPDGATESLWRCYCHPSGSYRDAVALHYRIEFLAGEPVAIVCPALDRRWEASRDFLRDCAAPFYAAADAEAARLMEQTEAVARSLAYITLADTRETRPMLRDCGHLGSERPRVATAKQREAA